MASHFYTTGLKECLDGTIDMGTDTFKLMLINDISTGYVPDKDHLVVDAAGANDPIDQELSVAGYTGGWGGAGRKTVTLSFAANLTDDRVDVAIDDQTWTSLATGQNIVAAILIKEGVANDTTSRLIAYFDVTDTPTNGGDVTLDFNTIGAGGNMRISV